jgi:hypothetical protein
VWRVWNLQSKNNFKVDFSSAAILHWSISSVIDRNRNRPFNLIQNKIGYRSCLATGVVNCGYNIKVYFKIETHEIQLRIRKNTRRTVCTIRSAVNHHGHRGPGFFNKKLTLDYYFCLNAGPVFLFQIFIKAPLPLPRDVQLFQAHFCVHTS